MAEGSYRKESEGYNVEDMDEGSDEVGEEDMVEGNDYEEFGAFGGYGALTSFDIRILRAFGSLGPGFRILAVRPLLGHLLALGLLSCDVREDGRRGRAGVRNVAGQHMPSHTRSCATRMRDGLRLPACCCLTIQSREELV